MRQSAPHNLTGIAEIGADDPEPEFVDINELGETVLTLQENNHLAEIDKSGAILSHFTAGSVDLTDIDTKDERGALTYTESQPQRLREPDGVQWIDNDHFAIANEGDMVGGARGMTIFNKNGCVVWESAACQLLPSHICGHGDPHWLGAISGMVADEDDMIYAVNDSFYSNQPRILKIDPSQTPAQITAEIDVTRNGLPAQKLDIEGFTLDGNGGFWIASEGRTDRVVPHALYNVNSEGQITQEVGLPPELMAVEKRFGFEGIPLVGYTLWMPVQREWNDDPANHVRLVSYNIESGDWGAVLYEKSEPKTGWVGPAESNVHGRNVYIVERDNQHAGEAVTKAVYAVPLSEQNQHLWAASFPWFPKR